MVFGLCPTGTEFNDFTKTRFELLRVCILQKYGSQSLARLFVTIPDFNHHGRFILIESVSTKQRPGTNFPIAINSVYYMGDSIFWPGINNQIPDVECALAKKMGLKNSYDSTLL